ncbi:MAG: TsaC protein (YrdC domain) required for threonylcarbamoyladenosine t(6)A37 modification in tRNA [uncultured Sulfurovum sp.]|uniref:TsaC protein (YrdC domain) required for threonylcarbamoyladenosine t(6)A37 modification in tRNA n=1 Tax=uncultured Sulfurovum sp. TaxID=269237 RepID=A0A6S6UH12_9BACT|nr:MAG: TsaC protein (YrdC domain) required for threonylcarbamoyladenosine t(6)A37 modification in tRNA [uncultured Sulfurovum sp.]
MLNEKVFLTQTDTTIGFVSQNKSKLTIIKKRPSYKHYIKAVNSLQTLKTFTRVPSSHKNRVRRAKKSTFIMPNGLSYRVIKDKHHLLLLNRLKWVYTTSANLSNESYDEIFARDAADIIVEPLHNENSASKIYKLRNHHLKRIR